MRSRYLAARIASALIVASPLALGAPGGGTLVSQYKTFSNSAQGSTCDNTSCTYFSAQVYDDQNGVVQGVLNIYITQFPFTTQFVYCSGPAYANILAVDQHTFKTTINASVSSSDPGCFFSPAGATTVNITGIPDGKLYESTSGHGTATTDSGYTAKFKAQLDSVSENFTGTAGYFTGNLSGYILLTRRTDLSLQQ
jgi:hypothetical protein